MPAPPPRPWDRRRSRRGAPRSCPSSRRPSPRPPLRHRRQAPSPPGPPGSPRSGASRPCWGLSPAWWCSRRWPGSGSCGGVRRSRSSCRRRHPAPGCGSRPPGRRSRSWRRRSSRSRRATISRPAGCCGRSPGESRGCCRRKDAGRWAPSRRTWRSPPSERLPADLASGLKSGRSRGPRDRGRGRSRAGGGARPRGPRLLRSGERASSTLMPRRGRRRPRATPCRCWSASPRWRACCPGSSDPDDLRGKAAAAVEAQAEALVRDGRYAEAAARLAPVERTWPDRPGLRERVARYQTIPAERDAAGGASSPRCPTSSATRSRGTGCRC